MKARPYAALSYCWGGEQRVKTTIESHSRYMQRIDISELPDTIKDAIFVTIELGLEYLWVDALCIIQDDPNDRDMELTHVPDVYSQATVTILASRAPAVHDGFLQPRTAPPPSFRLPFQCPDGTLDSVDLYLHNDYQPSEPLDTRGWALQERLLSTRMLDFSTLQTRWICHKTTDTEDEVEGQVDGWKPEITDKLLHMTYQAMRREMVLQRPLPV